MFTKNLLIRKTPNLCYYENSKTLETLIYYFELLERKNLNLALVSN